MVSCGCWINSKSQSQFLGPLCLWQCFFNVYFINVNIFCSSVVWLVGTISLFCEATVPFILKKVYWPQTTRERLFSSSLCNGEIEVEIKYWSVNIAFPTWAHIVQGCTEGGQHVIGSIYRPLSVCSLEGKGNRTFGLFTLQVWKLVPHLPFHTISFQICLNPALVGTGSDIGLKSEKEFSFPHSKSVPHQASLL